MSTGLPLYVYGNPANLVNNAPVNANSLQSGVWELSRHGIGDAVRVRSFTTRPCEYNALQLQVQRRLSKGLQMGLAYTLAKGEGYGTAANTGYDPVYRRDRWGGGDQGALLGADDRRP